MKLCPNIVGGPIPHLPQDLSRVGLEPATVYGLFGDRRCPRSSRQEYRRRPERKETQSVHPILLREAQQGGADLGGAALATDRIIYPTFYRLIVHCVTPR